jgi:hypothetical protein
MEFQYIILPGSYHTNDKGLSFHNQAFMIWTEFWSQLLGSLPSPTKLNPNEFSRQTYISLLLTPQEAVAGMSLHTIFNLESSADLSHSYFENNYDPQFRNRLLGLNLKQIMTIEYLTVRQEFRKNKIGFSLATLLGGLAHRIQRETGVAGFVTSCRLDLKMDHLSKMFGGKPLSAPGLHYGIQTQNLLTLSENLVELPEVSMQINKLWHDRKTIGTDVLIEGLDREEKRFFRSQR